MELLQSYKSELTNDQKRAIDAITRFLVSEIPCFILKGYAGTGKTFLMKGLTDYFQTNEIGFSLMSPTGRAAKVLSKGTNKKAYTVHKSIYSFDKLEEYKETDERGEETFKFYYALKSNVENAKHIYIVDEASMVSDKYSDAEFFRFGSGFLLKDMIDYVNFKNKYQKILFVGDDAQLPPINMKFSPALSSKYLKTEHELECNEFQLKDVVRQSENSGILYNATNIRNKIENNEINTFEIFNNFPDLEQITHDQILNKYLEAVELCKYTTIEEKINGSTVLICAQNSQAYEYNKLIRLHYFPYQDEIANKDKIMVLNNNYNYEIELLNGDFGLVLNIENSSETRRITLKHKNKETNITEEIPVLLSFRDALIRFWDVTSKAHDIKCKILENTLKPLQHNLKINIDDNNQIPKSYLERDISSAEMNAIYIDAKIRFPYKEPAKKEFSSVEEYKRQKAIYHQQFKDFLRTDTYFNALRIKFGYAITCHKAQGGEWQNPIVDFKFYNENLNKSYFRWAYTALTRAKTHLYHFNAPNLNISSKIIWQVNESVFSENIHTDLAFQNLVNDNFNCMEIDNNVYDNFSLSDKADFLKGKFREIFFKLKNHEIIISHILHRPHLEKYTFQKGDNVGIINFDYNKNSIFNKPRPQNQNQFEIEICKLLDEPLSVNYLQAEFNFTTEEKHLFEFFNNIKYFCVSRNIIINAIQHNQYCERYSFRRFKEIAIVNFDYDRKNIFTNARPEITNSQELLSEIKLIFL